MINTCFYYYIAKHTTEQPRVLTAASKQAGKGFHITLKPQDNDQLGQLWMFRSNETEDAYYIVQCNSGLVLEIGKDRSFDLHHCKGRQSQLFKPNVISAELMIFTISQFSQPNTIFMKDSALASDFKEQNDPDTKWILKRSLKNRMVLTSAVIQSQYSGYVMEAADNAEKEGAAIQQNNWNGTFGQRWVLQRFKEFYFIRNLRSIYVVTMKGKKSKEGTGIVQQRQNEANHKYQLWSLEERGHRLYAIRLASEQELYLGTKNNQLSEGAEIILVRDPFRLWRIVCQTKI